MPYQFPPVVEDLVRQHMSTGQYPSEDELLLDALHALAERNETLLAIQAGIEDVEAGRMRSFEEVADEVRRKDGFSARPRPVRCWSPSGPGGIGRGR